MDGAGWDHAAPHQFGHRVPLVWSIEILSESKPGAGARGAHDGCADFWSTQTRCGDSAAGRVGMFDRAWACTESIYARDLIAVVRANVRHHHASFPFS